MIVERWTRTKRAESSRASNSDNDQADEMASLRRHHLRIVLRAPRY